MKYSVKQYATALYGALEGKKPKEAEEAAKRFALLVRKNGDSPRLRLILSAFEKEYLKNKKLQSVAIEMASPVPTRVKREIKNALGEKIVFSEYENASLDGGIRIMIDGEILIDASAARQIIKMLK